MYRIGIVTVSDKGAMGQREDASGPALKEMVTGLGMVEYCRIIPDDPPVIEETLIALADDLGLDLVLTTGGTGLGPRDNTPEATLAVIERQVPGLAEFMRMEGAKKTPRAVLSRGVAGIRGRTLIINLPGNPKGAAESLEAILPVLPHALEIVSGKGGECGG